MQIRSRALALAAFAALPLAALPPVAAAAISLGQIDDFQDGTLQGWQGGSSPTNVATGGPAGAGDRYLELDSSGFSLGAFNTAQWSGDYDAAGVGSLRLDLNNFGPDPVSLRVVLFTPGCAFGGNSCTAWASSAPTTLLAGSGWVSATFTLDESVMTRVLGSDSFLATLQGAERLLLRHDPSPLDPPGSPSAVDAVLGVDNVTALPEPASGALVACGLAALALAARRRSATGA